MRRIPVETYSRVVGYYRPTFDWNRSKQAEFALRKFASPARIKEQLSEKNLPKIS